MKKINKIATIFLSLILIISFSVGSIADSVGINEGENIFDEYGFKINNNMDAMNISSIFNNEVWESFPSKTNIPLDKVWTVKFSSDVLLDKIDAIVIERDSEFIPVKIRISSTNEIQVSPTYGFSGDTDYQMKVFLENNKKYKMNFRTTVEPRDADVEPNHRYTDGQQIYLNETVIGSFMEEDYNDFYKIEIPSNGRLDLTAIQLGGGEVDLYLYGPNGDDKSSIKYTYNKTTATLSAGLSEGIYYIRVNYSGYYGKYTLENIFTESPYEDDNGISNYINAEELKLNDTMTGHIGYVSDYNYGNYNDYFKIIIPEDGRLIIDAKQLHGGNLDMYLYGATGPDKSSIRYIYNKTSPSIDIGLAKGTYYLRLNNSGYYGPYELSNKFYPDPTPNDSASNNYILADEIGSNDTVYGHIGYVYDNTGINQNDYYKVEILEQGRLSIEAIQLDGGDLDLYLYGSKGTDSSALNYVYNKSKAELSRELIPGTYYIRINYSGNYGGYELNTDFR